MSKKQIEPSDLKQSINTILNKDVEVVEEDGEAYSTHIFTDRKPSKPALSIGARKDVEERNINFIDNQIITKELLWKVCGYCNSQFSTRYSYKMFCSKRCTWNAMKHKKGMKEKHTLYMRKWRERRRKQKKTFDKQQGIARLRT